MISEAAMYIDVPKGSITVAINGHKSLYAADLLTAITVLFFVRGTYCKMVESHKQIAFYLSGDQKYIVVYICNICIPN